MVTNLHSFELISLLTLDRDAEQAGKAGKKIGVVLIELAGIGTVDFEHPEEGLTFSALSISPLMARLMP